ncbi:single-stranded DNA-binding protein [Sanguibacter suaedae]|uniref:Single-stranded DNA-binding protein n=1 Tax=Sanguibacter suaedae TaxID=2795737 RepID=A0A934I3T4_9MICO|nr:single-stranded DNA-binding protein [Sanguibacter suaedae]MBI9115069.1 single-stranded DNA-binding protein [Sanguibacter suaedae]
MSVDTKVTVAGWVGTQPKHFVSESGTDFTSFRLASTKRYFDRAEERWVDGPTTWFTVKTWRGTAVNVAESLRRSDPVVVHGTLTSEEWTSPEGPRSSFVIEADALGPDLSRGQATFRHTVHQRATDGDGGPRGAARTTDGEDALDTPDSGKEDVWTVAPGGAPAPSDASSDQAVEGGTATDEGAADTADREELLVPAGA